MFGGMWTEGIPGRGNSTSKDLDVGSNPVHSENVNDFDCGRRSAGRSRLDRVRRPSRAVSVCFPVGTWSSDHPARSLCEQVASPAPAPELCGCPNQQATSGTGRGRCPVR